MKLLCVMAEVKCLSRNDGNSYSATEKLFKSQIVRRL